MKARYSPAFVEQALVKVFSRGGMSVQAVADNINVNYHTLKNWMVRKAVAKTKTPATKEKRPQDWSAQEQLVALHETHGMNGEILSAWCREHGIFPHHLIEWQAAFCTVKKADPAESVRCACSRKTTTDCNVRCCARTRHWRRRQRY